MAGGCPIFVSFAGFLQTTHAPVNREVPAARPQALNSAAALPQGPQFRKRDCGPFVFIGLAELFRGILRLGCLDGMANELLQHAYINLLEPLDIKAGGGHSVLAQPGQQRVTLLQVVIDAEIDG